MMSEDSTSRPYVYHRVPQELRGTVLYPLNQLRDIEPDLFERLQENYATRRDIASLRIPPLGNCLWNDVLFFSPVHPSLHLSALEAAGLTLPSEWRRYFQIDAALLEASDAVIYEGRTIFWSGSFDVDAASATLGSECLPFRLESLSEYDKVQPRASEYYATVEPGAPFPLFLHTPHILYQGRLDLDQQGIGIVEV